MQRKKLLAQQVLPRGDAFGDGGVGPAAVGDHVVDAPLARSRVEAVFGDLGPTETVGRCGGCVVDLGQVCRDGPLVGGRDRVVRVVGILRAADDVAPPRADAVARIDADDLIRVGSGKTAAQLLVVDVVDGVVRRGSTQADELAFIGAVDREFLVGNMRQSCPICPSCSATCWMACLEDTMRSGQSRQGNDGGALHG